MNKKTIKHFDLAFRISFLFIYVATLLIPSQTIAAAPAPIQQTPSAAPALELPQPLADVASAPGPEPAPGGYTIVSQDLFSTSVDGAPADTGIFSGIQPYVAPVGYPKSATNGNLSIIPITAYNVIVDSNVLTPASYGPSAATIGAEFCNTGGSAMTNVWAYTGDFNSDGDATINEVGDKTPGVYPQRLPASIAENAILQTKTFTDYGDPTRTFALEHESGTSSDSVDASRYIGDLAAGQCKTQYWLISYPRIACTATPCFYGAAGAVSVTGPSIKPDDDLWLPYYFWATNSATVATPSYYWNPLTMRNEISAMANKIWPNGDNKVPPEYIAAIQDVLGWNTWVPGGGSVAFPGQTATSQGIWYDFGNVGAGFDNNGDLLPDRNAWVQPIGDAGAYDPGCFRLVRTYGLVVVKLNDGTEYLIPFVDKMYFENIPDNNTGAVGLVYYEYQAMDGACSAGLTPYQEVASGYDNEKFNADFGAGVPPLQSQQTTMTFDKSGDTTKAPGGTVNYTLTFTLPDANAGDATTTISVGSPSVGGNLTFADTVPDGLQFVSNSASTTATMTNPAGSQPLTLLASKDSGVTWYDLNVVADQTTFCAPAAWPCNKASTSPSSLVMIQWRLTNAISSPLTGAATTGQVAFSAIVPGAYVPKEINNTACMNIGGGVGFTCDTHKTLISGNSAIVGTVWKDDGLSGGTAGNGSLDETIPAAAIPNVTVKLYWDSNGDGDFADAGDFLYATTTSNANGDYCFGGTLTLRVCTPTVGAGLPDANAAPAGSPRYIIVVDPADTDIPTGYGPSTTITYTKVALPAATVYGDTQATEPSNFGFTPALKLDKSVLTTTPLVVGDTVQYSIAVTNTLPGNGTGGASCVYDTYATSEGSQSNSATYVNRFDDNGPGASPATTVNVFTSPEPDGVFSVSSYAASGTQVLDGIGFGMGQQSGDITNVKARVKLYISNNFADGAIPAATSDYGGIQYWAGAGPTQYTSTPVGTQAQQNATTTILQTRVGVANAGWYELDLGATNAATGAAWKWADLVAGNNIHIVWQSGKQGSGDAVLLHIDTIALQVTTNGTCGGSATTLNPVPLVDTFNSSYFTFVSSDPPVSSSTASSLTWNNVGPLYPGQTRIVTVNMRAILDGTTTNTDNTATSTNSKFASGLPANSPVTDTATVVIGVNAATRTLSGRVFDDNNTNGWQAALWTQPGTAQTGFDAGDVGIQYIPVDLYACVNSATGALHFGAGVGANQTCAQQTNGVWQYLQTISTDASGNYSFTNLRQGYYYTQIHSEYISYTTKTADVNANGACAGACDDLSNLPAGGGTNDLKDTTFVGNLDANTAITNVNFGYNVPTGTYVIGDTLFFDWDGDGVQDPEDEPIYNATIRLRGADGTLITTTTTDVNGKYCFGGTIILGVCTLGAGYPQGYYTVEVDTSSLPSGVVQTKDPDATMDNQSRFALTANNLTQDFAYRPLGSGTIGDTVFKDVNGNGTQDSAEIGIIGVTVELQVNLNSGGGDATWVTVKTAVTDSNGKYLFTGLPAGDYRVKIDLDNAPYPNSTAIPNDSLGNDYKPSSTVNDTTIAGQVFEAINLPTNSSNNLTADFPFAPPAAIGDTVYNDVNGNGTQDTGEPGISGVTVTLYTFTDALDGKYSAGDTFLIANDTNGNGRYDLGETFTDVVGNGRYDVAELGTLVAVTTDITDSSGIYGFGNLNPGNYVVGVTSGLPGGISPTDRTYLSGDPNTDGFSCLTSAPNPLNIVADPGEPSSTVCDAKDGMRLYAGTNYMGADFGYQIPGSFGDMLWVDTNNDGIRNYADANSNGVQDLGEAFTEAGIPNITVTAVTANNVTVNGVNYPAGTTLTTSTNADGTYSFQNITPVGGNTTWTVTVSTADPDFPSGLTNSYDPDGTLSSSTTVIMNTSGAVTSVGGCSTLPNGCDPAGDGDPLKLDVDFGYKYTGSAGISGTICLDTTIDGFCGVDNEDTSGVAATGETGYASTTVYLYKLTDTNGNLMYTSGETTTLVATTSTSAYKIIDGKLDIDKDGSITPADNGTSAGCTVTAGVLSGCTTYNGLPVIGGYIDVNRNGTTNPDTNDDLEVGDYSFANLPTGVYLVAIGAPQTGLDLTSTTATINAGTVDSQGVGGGDTNNTTQLNETLAADGVTTLSVYQAVNVPTNYTVVDRDFAFQLSGAYDFGDLPASYSTTLAGTPDGARALIPVTPTLYLGSAATQAELISGDATPSTTANTDAKEDGVSVPTGGLNTSWNDADGGILTYNVTGPGVLIIWIDINKDGDFADANEMVVNKSVTTGTVTTPAILALSGMADGNYAVRARLFPTSPVVASLAYSGASTNGEVEDYIFPINAGVPTPVTLSYFLAQRNGINVNFNWSTATETGNVGFNLYLETEGGLTLINETLIQSKNIDSLERQDYSYSIDMAGETFYIEDISILGQPERHGPFNLGEQYGNRVEADKIDQAAIQAEHDEKYLEQQNALKQEMANPEAALPEAVSPQASLAGVSSSVQQARTPKPTATLKPTRTPKPTATIKPTRTPKPTATIKPTRTPIPSKTPNVSATPNATNTAVPTTTSTATETATGVPTATATDTPTSTSEPTATATATDTATSTSEPTATGEPSTATATATATGVPIPELTVTFNLKVRKTGLYRVTYEMLKDAGLDLAGVSSANLTLLNRGKTVPIYINLPSEFGPAGFIEFYGEALDTIYTDTNIYTLGVSKDMVDKIQNVNAEPNLNLVAPGSYTETLIVNNQRSYANYAPSTDAWYDTDMFVFTDSKSWTFPFEINGLADPSASASLKLLVWGVTDWPNVNPDHHLLVSINGVALADESFNGLMEKSINATLPAGTLHEGTNTLQLTLPGDTGVQWDMVNLDKFSIDYQRSFQAQNGRINFTATGKVFNITNLPTSNVVVYRTDANSTTRLNNLTINPTDSTFSASFAGSDQPAAYQVTTEEAFHTPTLEATKLIVDLNQPAQYLIIAHPDFIDGIQPLAQARKAQGFTVSVVDVNDLYTQYSYGIFDPQAIKKYIAYAAKNLGTQYVLLVGGDTYDYRNHLGTNSISFIPSLYITTGDFAKFVPSDPFYTDLDGNNVPDLAIGRFPVRTNAELNMMISKTLAYAAKDYGRTAVFASDVFDGIVSYKDISNAMVASLPAGWSSQSIHLDDVSVSTAQQQLIAAMNAGTALVTFTGHSGPTKWTFSNLFTTNDAAALTNAGRPFVAVQWGCWNTYYVDPVNNYLVQSLLFSGDKGAAAVLGAATLTDSESEALLGVLLNPRMATPGKPIGLALQEAKNELALTHPGLLDVLLGWSLMGDPTLVIQP